ncbi:MAG: DEAD/DEAH box helicase [Ectothiorhodospiraceae bacterium]|nr:DEAD/DEAH box helicase [Ectothiorhodospiraceae bacterium]MCH8505353.1 DEAD/DEAH box helicase [Ectothiorhodospiraceae bacterium]
MLVTTPESLSLLLSDREAHQRLRHLRSVVVDEWHELMGSKRGVQLELCLAHLRTLCPVLRSWGVSATPGNLDQAAEVLLGGAGQARLIQGLLPKQTRISSLIPERMERFPWAGHLGTMLLLQVMDALERARSTLLFTNTRSQAELWHERCWRPAGPRSGPWMFWCSIWSRWHSARGSPTTHSSQRFAPRMPTANSQRPNGAGRWISSPPVAAH